MFLLSYIHQIAWTKVSLLILDNQGLDPFFTCIHKIHPDNRMRNDYPRSQIRDL